MGFKLFWKKKILTEDVFTPSTSAKLTFVDRPELDNQINKALKISGMQLILYGHSGGGKSTIIQNILKKQNLKYISINCTPSTTLNSLIYDAFDMLNPYYISEKTNKKTDSISTNLRSTYLGISSALKTQLSNEKTDKQLRLLPIQLNPQRLAEFLGNSEVIWIIEDFHKVASNEREKLTQILKIFVDTSDKYKKVKIIAIGAVGSAREVVNYNNELTNRVSEIYVPLLTPDELDSIICKGEKLLNISFDNNIRSSIINYSNSLASICHHICYSICYNSKINTKSKIKKIFKEKDLQIAVEDYLKQNSDSFKQILDRAIKIRNDENEDAKMILEAFCNNKKEELTFGEIHNYKSIRKANKLSIRNTLDLLTTAEYGEIIRYDTNSGKYYFSNPFLKAYTIMSLSKENNNFSALSKYDMNEIKIVMEIIDKNDKVIYRSVKSNKISK